jgi:hypothetical protein
MTTGGFDFLERRWSVGTAYLRGQGTGTITGVHGLDALQRRLGHLVVESRLPRVGAATSDIYEGDGHVIVRAAQTDTVAAALRELVAGITVDIGPARGTR